MLKTLTRNLFLILIIALSFLVNLYGINWGLPSFEGWAADEVIPSIILDGIHQKFSNGWHYKYPPFHFYILTVFYSPILLLNSFKLLDINRLETYTLLFYIGRFVSVLMATASVYIVYCCGREIFDKPASLFTALITALLMPCLYYAKTLNLEAPYLFWFLCSLLFYLRILKHHRLRDYLGFVITAVFSICTKDQAYGFYLLTPIAIIFSLYSYQRQQNPKSSFIKAVFNRRIIGSFLLSFSLFILIHNIVFNLQGFIDHVDLITAGDASIRPRVETNLYGQLSILIQSFTTHLRFSFGWPIYLICIIGFLRYLFSHTKNPLLAWIWVPAISYYLFYICVVMYNDVRYLLPIAITLSFFGGKLIADLLNSNQALYYPKITVISAIFVYTFAYAFSVNHLMVNDSRYFVEDWMKNHINQNQLVVGVGEEKYLPRLRFFNSQIINPKPNYVSELNPDYIVISSGYDQRRFKPETPGYEFFDKLETGEFSYRQVLKHKSHVRWSLFNDDEVNARQLRRMKIYSNFDKINPEITIYQKTP